MAADPFNSVGGFTVAIPPIEVIDSNGNIVSNFLNLSGNVAANKVYANSYYYANGNPFISSPGGSNTQLQFNNNGEFGGIPNVTFDGNILNLGDITTLNIGGGLNGYFLQTDGTGNLTWAAGGGGGGNGSPGGANTQVQFNDAGEFGGDAGFTYNKITNTLHVDNIDSSVANSGQVNISGNLSVIGNVSGNYFIGDGSSLTNVSAVFADTSDYVVQNNQSNITSLGNLVSLNVSGNTLTNTLSVNNKISGSTLEISGNITANGNIAGSYIVGDGSGLTNVSAVFANLTDYVVQNNQSNITSVGNLVSLNVIGNITTQSNVSANRVSAANINISNTIYSSSAVFTQNVSIGNQLTINNSATLNVVGNLNASSSSNVTFGDVSTLHISGGFNGYVLGTDGSGNLSWIENGGGGGGNGTPGGANTQVQYNKAGNFGGSPFFTFNEVTQTLQVSGNLVANTVQIGAGGFNWATSKVFFASTVSSNPDQLLYTIPVNQISGVEFDIMATDTIGQSRQFCKISSVYFNNTVQYNEYASLFVNGGVGSFDVSYNPGNIIVQPSLELKVTPSTSNSVNYKMLITVFSP